MKQRASVARRCDLQTAPLSINPSSSRVLLSPTDHLDPQQKAFIPCVDACSASSKDRLMKTVMSRSLIRPSACPLWAFHLTTESILYRSCTSNALVNVYEIKRRIPTDKSKVPVNLDSLRGRTRRQDMQPMRTPTRRCVRLFQLATVMQHNRQHLVTARHPLTKTIDVDASILTWMPARTIPR